GRDGLEYRAEAALGTSGPRPDRPDGVVRRPPARRGAGRAAAGHGRPGPAPWGERRAREDAHRRGGRSRRRHPLAQPREPPARALLGAGHGPLDDRHHGLPAPRHPLLGALVERDPRPRPLTRAGGAFALETTAV